MIELRKKRGLSQRALANQLQLIGVDIDKNVITRLETNNRRVFDMELQALCRVLHVSYDDLINDLQ